MKILDKILNFLFPKKCLGCRKPNVLICDKCLKEIPRPDQHQPDIIAAMSYKSAVIKKAVHLLKYGGAKILAEPLAELIFKRLKEPGDHIFNWKQGSRAVIIPIPLSGKRLKERGFNQAELIAKHLSNKMSVIILNNVLYKNRHTYSQVEIKDRGKRLVNLKGSFSVRNPEFIKNKTVFLVDDVSTTGATINEAKKELKKAGAQKVIGLVLAQG